MSSGLFRQRPRNRQSPIVNRQSIGAGGGSRTPTSVTTRQILELGQKVLAGQRMLLDWEPPLGITRRVKLTLKLSRVLKFKANYFKIMISFKGLFKMEFDSNYGHLQVWQEEDWQAGQNLGA